MFLIHPAELDYRRKRCRNLVGTLASIERTTVLRCNVCSSEQNVILASKDRYGLPVRTAMCQHCGLVYLVDPFTYEGYNEFYATGAYRTVSSLFLGTQHRIDTVQANQVSYARMLTNTLRGYLPGRSNSKLLDVGGSAGIVAFELQKQFGLEGTVLDPSVSEVDSARKLGLRATVGSLETWDTDERFDVILLCRSVEHLFDLRGCLTKLRSLLQPNGLFYCDISDFPELCRWTGAPETVIKIDHCYWLSQETAPAIFRTLGFEIISTNLVHSWGQVGFLMRRCEPSPLPSRDHVWVAGQIRMVQEIERQWLQCGRAAPSFKLRARARAYRIKRWLQKLTNSKHSSEKVPTGGFQTAA